MQFGRIALLLISLSLCSMLLGQLPPVGQNIVIRRGIVYRTVEGKALALDLYRPEEAAGPLPVVIALHGGSWVAGDRDTVRPIAEYLAGMGYAVAAIEYRLAPRWIFPAQLEDARAAAAWVRANAEAQGFDMRRCFLLGVSAGGQLAGLLGTQDETAGQFAGVVLLSAPTDFTVPAPSLKARIAVRMYLGAEQQERPDLYAAASPISYVSAGDPPFLVVHGAEDEYVPPAQAARMVDALRARQVPATLLALPGVGHEVPSPRARTGAALMRAVLSFLADPRAEATAEK